MRYARRLLVCAACSVGGHVLVAAAAARLPARADAPHTTLDVEVVVAPAPPPPAPPPPAPEEAPVEPAVTKRVKAAPPRLRPVPPAGPERPTPPAAAPAAGNAQPQVFSASMTSSSQANGPEVATGPAAHGPSVGGAGPASGRPDGAVVPTPADEVTRVPMPEGGCTGKYTDEARAAGTEGTVVLDVVVGADGRTRDIAVVHGLDHGLNDAAVAALKACRFTPGERDGKPVAVRIRTFKISFYLQGD